MPRHPIKFAEQIGESQSKSRHDLSRIQNIVFAKNHKCAATGVDGHGAQMRIDFPHQSNAQPLRSARPMSSSAIHHFAR